MHDCVVAHLDFGHIGQADLFEDAVKIDFAHRYAMFVVYFGDATGNA